MRILYVASGIPVPGTLGGSTHTLEVARGLAARGHTVHVVASSREGWGGLRSLARPVSTTLDGFHLHHLDIPKAAALLGAPVILRLARALRPDVVMERYYNFAGAGLLAAARLGRPSILEVNALIVDPPQVAKRRLDDALGGPMRRWALAQCRMASRIVTPLYTTVPPEIPRAKIVELPWGANVGRFAPIADCRSQITDGGASQAASCKLQATVPTVVFLGSFRAWHGALDFVRAAGLLLGQGRDVRFLLVGDGPERAAAERAAAAWPGRFCFTGAVPYEQVPALLGQATLGVAPFTTAPHPALRAAGFFWSPLKVYEYMAAGLPVVTADIHPLNQVVRDGQEGVLFREGDVAGLAAAIGRLLDDPAAARAMGARARARVAERYSWARHCEELEGIMAGLAAA
ncbi:MAG TPA: glycosyltransferase family 4 protein [Roseiflexaceae bacterium]|nr:glycosyltransferase family 4 protein [Roseiflexaceae bacterium]